MNSREVLLYFRAIQGHTGGNVTPLELMCHVAISYKWKEFLFHRGCSCDVTSIVKPGLIAGRRESKEGRQTIFFTPDEEELSNHLLRLKPICQPNVIVSRVLFLLISHIIVRLLCLGFCTPIFLLVCAAVARSELSLWCFLVSSQHLSSSCCFCRNYVRRPDFRSDRSGPGDYP